jgi:hypothetical protein
MKVIEMRIAIVTGWDAAMNGVAEVTYPNHSDYCSQHGYGHVTRHFWYEDRNPQWATLKLARECIHDWDWLCFSDVDLIFANKGVRLESFLDTQADLVASYDVNGLNAGIIFVRNCPWAVNFLGKWWHEGPRFARHPSDEQTSLAYLLYREPKDRWEVVPQRRFNSFRYEFYPWLDFPEGQYLPGDFVLHLPALSNQKRIEVFKEHLSGPTS